MKPVRWQTRWKVYTMRLSGRLLPLPERVKQAVPSEVKRIDTSAGKTKLLIFRPKNAPYGILPVYVSMHGGGFVMGSAAMDNPFCQETADQVGCLVVNVSYKLAPRYRFPVAVEECYDVVKWISQHGFELQIDPTRIAVGGHSAGGNLAAVICLLARQRKEFQIVYQVLDYPPLDLTRDPAAKTRVPPGSPVIPVGMARIFDECYIGSYDDARNPLVSPICEPDLRGLPPALVITAERDSLAEEGELYAARLKEAGVAVVQRQFPGVGHGFNLNPGPQTQAAWDLINGQLAQAFSR